MEIFKTLRACWSFLEILRVKIFASSQVSSTPEQPPLQYWCGPQSDFEPLSI